MNKAELITTVAQAADINKADAERVITAFADTVQAVLKNGDSVTLVGFGTFAAGQRAEREGRNPATGEAITIAAAKTVKFKAGKTLKDSIQ